MSRDILSVGKRSAATVGQLLTYDATFECGDIYVSPLVMRNTYLEDDSVFAPLFMLPEKGCDSMSK